MRGQGKKKPLRERSKKCRKRGGKSELPLVEGK